MMLSDPDFINQTIVWLCLREASLPSEIFITTLRLTDNCDELKATKELVSKEIQVLVRADVLMKVCYVAVSFLSGREIQVAKAICQSSNS